MQPFSFSLDTFSVDKSRTKATSPSHITMATGKYHLTSHVSLHSVKWLRGSASVLPTLHSRSSLPHKWMQLYKINGWCVPGLLPGTHPHTREAHVRSPHKCPRCAVFTGQRGQGRQQMSADWFLSACSSPRFLSPQSSRTKKSPERRALLIVAGVGSQLGTEVTVASGFSGVCGRNHRKWNESSVHCRYLASV